MKTNEEKSWNEYFFENENVLKNKLNIHDAKLLKIKEYEIVAKKLALLYLSEETGLFDIEHLKNIHKFLFEDIYDFAGEFRNVNMGKGTKASFIDYQNIEQNLKDILSNIDAKLISNSYSKFFYAESLAQMYKLLLEIHPFREGNGRTIREFLRQYVQEKNNELDNTYYELDFNLSKEDKNILEEATKCDTNGYLVLIFNKMLKEKEIEIHKELIPL